MTAFDWGGFEDAVTERIIGAARDLLTEAAGQTPYALALSEFYAETAGVIYLPLLALATEESVSDHDSRFSPPDWVHVADEWAATAPVSDWARRLIEAVDGLPRARWQESHGRYEQAMLDAIARVKKALVDDGLLASSVVCYLADEEGRLLRRSVTDAELAEHFPYYAEAEAAEAELLQLPAAARATRLAAAVGLIPGPAQEPGPLSSERATQLLLRLGADAVPAVIDGLAHAGTRWKAAKLLADLHLPTPDVLTALRAHLRCDDDEANRNWVAIALARLGTGHMLLDRTDLPANTVASGIAGPYRSFRDHAIAHLPLDYGLLSAALDRADLAPLLTEELAPGRGECTLDAVDLPGAVAGLDSPHALIRRHAASVLSWATGPMGDLDLDYRVRASALDRIRAMAADDPDESVRTASQRAAQPRLAW
ncbi:DUF4303 domain-containing protein [Longispora fulva]|uniref:HEAT repeat domain-containing protein n=1 Tax=Longispora fulva TaxID=619741 RepID=A0A8J7G6R5_9ACTN|nr:DUF4303 domain-containing protein [Longispora fulva]MBG6133955.1 hypothetical protein [Longispora fulva]